MTDEPENLPLTEEEEFASEFSYEYQLYGDQSGMRHVFESRGRAVGAGIAPATFEELIAETRRPYNMTQQEWAEIFFPN